MLQPPFLHIPKHLFWEAQLLHSACTGVPGPLLNPSTSEASRRAFVALGTNPEKFPTKLQLPYRAS